MVASENSDASDMRPDLRLEAWMGGNAGVWQGRRCICARWEAGVDESWLRAEGGGRRCSERTCLGSAVAGVREMMSS